MEYDLRKISSDDRLKLKMRQEDVGYATYLKKSAFPHQCNNLSVTYGAFDGEKVVGYVTLLCGVTKATEKDEVDIVALDDEVLFPYDEYPSVKVAKLAVGRDYERQGLGKTLIELSIAIVKEQIATWIGCRLVMLDAEKRFIPFYRDKCGFKLIDTAENKAREHPVMFMDIGKLEA